MAGKVEETPKKCKDVIKGAKDLLPDNKFLQFGPEARNWTVSIKIKFAVLKFILLSHVFPKISSVKYGNFFVVTGGGHDSRKNSSTNDQV